MKTSRSIIALIGVAAVAALAFAVPGASAAKPGGGQPPAAQQGGPGAPGGRPAPRGPQFVAPAAKYLGVKPAALLKQLKAKKTLASLAEAAGKSTDGLKSAILADAKAHLDKDVAADRIDQAAADERYAELQSRVDNIVTKVQNLRGGGRGDCPNKPGGPGAGAGGAAAPSTDTTAGDYGNGATTTTGASTGGAYL